MLELRGYINIILLMILFISLYIYYSITKTQIETFYEEPCYAKEQNIINNQSTKMRECSVYLVDDEQYSDCDKYYEYYEMSELELQQAIENSKNENSENVNAMREILQKKLQDPNMKGCKIKYEGWKEIQEYTDQFGKKYEYQKKNINNKPDDNFVLWNQCYIDSDKENNINLNETVKGGCVENDKFSSIYFENNMDVKNIFDSVCIPPTQSIDLEINNKYFLELECEYIPLQKIKILNAKYKKGINNNFVDINNYDASNTIQSSINNYFMYLYSKPDNGKLLWVPKYSTQESYLLKYDKCNNLNGINIINISNFNLNELGVSNKIANIELINDIKTQIEDTNTGKTHISVDEIQNSFNQKIQLYNTAITRLENDISNIQKSFTTDITPQSSTTASSNKSEMLQTILNSRTNTNNKIRDYITYLTNIKINKNKPSYNLTSANLEIASLATSLNNIINDEYIITKNNIDTLYQNLNNLVNEKFIDGMYINFSIYENKNIVITNTRDFSRYIKCNTPLVNMNKTDNKCNVGDCSKTNNDYTSDYVLTEYLYNAKFEPGYYNFYIDNKDNNTSTDVFLTYLNNNNTAVYQKVAYYYGTGKNYEDGVVSKVIQRSNNTGLFKTFSYDSETNLLKYSFEYDNLESVDNVLSNISIFGTNNNSALNNPNASSWEYMYDNNNINYKITTTQNENTEFVNLLKKENGLLALYKFDGNNNDSSGNNYHLTSGNVSYQNNKMVGTHSAKFQGYLTNSSINLNNTHFSICCWVYKYSNDQYVIIGMGNQQELRKQLHIGFRNNNKLMFAFYADDADSTSTYDINNKWIHVAYTYDYVSRIRKIYLNGNEVNVSGRVAGGTPNFATGTLKVGKQNYGNSINANLDDLRIYNRVLTLQEIQIIYNNKLTTDKYLLQYNTNIISYENVVNDTELNNDNSLYCHYKFDSNLEDSFGNNDATGYGSFTYDSVDKKSGNSSLKLNGGYLKVPSTDFSRFNNGITISTWVKINSNFVWTRIVDFGDGNPKNNIVLSNWEGNRRLIIHVFRNDKGYKNAYTLNDCVFKNVWTHIVLTIQPASDNIYATWKLYVNGVMQKLNNENDHFFPHTSAYANCYIGKSNWGNHDLLLRGNIDDFRIYKRVLTANEVLQLYGNIRKYPPIPLSSKSINDNITSANITGKSYGNGTYSISWSSDYGIWKPPHFFDGVNISDGGSEGGHFELHSYNTSTGKYKKNKSIDGKYLGEWIKITFPKELYLNNIRLYQRGHLTSRAPVDYKLYGKNGALWEELLHEKNAVYNDFIHVSKRINNIISYNTFALCINKIGNNNGESYVLNFDEIEFYGSEDAPKINNKKYKHYMIKSNDSNNVAWPKINIISPPVNGYTSKAPFKINNSNSGYYGVYIRTLLPAKNSNDNITNIKYTYSKTNQGSYLELNKSYTDTNYTVVSDSHLKTASVFNVRKLIFKDSGKNIFPIRPIQNCNVSDGPDIIDDNFYIKCESMPSYNLDMNKKPVINYVNISQEINNTDYVQNMSSTVNTDINETNLQNAIKLLSEFRSSLNLDFKCMISNNEWNNDFNVLNNTKSDSSDIMEKNKIIQEKNKLIDQYQTNIKYYQNVMKNINDNKNININIYNDVINKIVNSSIELTDEKYKKYMKGLTKNINNNKFYMYLKLETNLIS